MHDCSDEVRIEDDKDVGERREIHVTGGWRWRRSARRAKTVPL